jgi:hypothetical protein
MFWTRQMVDTRRPALKTVSTDRVTERFSSPIDAAFAAFSELASSRRHYSEMSADGLDLGPSVDQLAEDQNDLDSKLLFEAALSELFGED